PYFRFPAHVLKYPSKQQVIDYLESYAAHCQLDPVFGQEVTEVRRKNDSWESTTQDTRYLSQNLVVPTGYTRKPYCPSWPDQEKYRGRVLHSSEYKNGEPFKGKDVLVVGFGNSGGEIAIDLWVHGARPALSVRSPVNIVPRDMHGFPILGWSIVLSFLPTRLADFLSKPLAAQALHPRPLFLRAQKIFNRSADANQKETANSSVGCRYRKIS
ncbi:MAG: NAD(P)-binding domain-containing protein, partial [Calditrichae bacterium]|nr:NAD(P)-binding domain-containing protein [Calditrichia bacterium]NIV72010.1 NAD(P)-binding domain-containing protein [Calditrichia bacterium]